jgi:hypothetical protein
MVLSSEQEGLIRKKRKLTNAVKSESILLPQFAQDLVPDSAATSGCGFAAPCSLGLSPTSQQYFSLRTNNNQQPKSAVLFSQNKSAPDISHQPNACGLGGSGWPSSSDPDTHERGMGEVDRELQLRAHGPLSSRRFG